MALQTAGGASGKVRSGARGSREDKLLPCASEFQTQCNPAKILGDPGQVSQSQSLQLLAGHNDSPASLGI